MEFEAKSSTTAHRSISDGRSASEERSTARPNPVILSVDDEPDNLTVLRLFLSTEGFEVIAASNGAEALHLIEEHCPDLIITDFTMPAMTGLEFCRILRERVEARGIPIILYSGTDLREADPDLFDRFVLKPAELDVFARAIRDLLSIAASKSTRLIPAPPPLPRGQ